MTAIESIDHQLTLIGGNLAFLLFLIVSIQLYRTQRSRATFAFLLGMLAVWVGMLTQWFAPMPDFSYIKEEGEIVGATGTFSQTWYLGSIVFYLGLLTASIGLSLHVLVGGRGAKDNAQ